MAVDQAVMVPRTVSLGLSPPRRRKHRRVKPPASEHLHAMHVGHEEKDEEKGKTVAGAMEEGEHEQYSSMDGARSSFLTRDLRSVSLVLSIKEPW